MKISKRVREEAIVLCSIAASNYDVTIHDLGISSDHPALQLASDARFAVDPKMYFRPCDEYQNAAREAEGLLRDGWCPGDPVVPWVPR